MMHGPMNIKLLLYVKYKYLNIQEMSLLFSLCP